MNEIHVSAFYRFLPLSIERVREVRRALEDFARRTGLRGLCLLGEEGINATLSGDEATMREMKVLVARELGADDIFFKDSRASRHPFRVFTVKIKKEIVTLGRPGLAPKAPKNFHLSPEEWHAALSDPNTLILDTRNDYEVEIGKFRGAVDFNIKEFREFPERLRASGLPKDKRVLIYCTGGIRCEKAILEMHQQGFENVYQLDGGILNYMEKFPQQAFEGECFVFDYRVAVDQKLEPTRRYKLCPHCGQPADVPLSCSQCAQESVICGHCASEGHSTCSKNCAHHAEIGSRSRKPHRQELRKRAVLR